MNDLVPSAHMDGDIDYRGESLYAPSVSPVAVRRRIGMVFQKPNPFPKSIYGNVAYGPRINGIRKKSQLDELLDSRPSAQGRAVGRGEEPARRVGVLGLSGGGQAQRLCIARTIAVEPDAPPHPHRVLVEHGPTQQIFENPHDKRTEAYVTGRIG